MELTDTVKSWYYVASCNIVPDDKNLYFFLSQWWKDINTNIDIR